MEKLDVTVRRKGKSKDWVFSWSEEHQGLVHETRANVYKLFFENPALAFKPIWIGILMHDGACWVTVEKGLRAESIELFGSTVLFT